MTTAVNLSTTTKVRFSEQPQKLDFEKEISKINATQIELIGNHLVEKIKKRIGPLETAKTALQVLSIKGINSNRQLELRKEIAWLHSSYLDTFVTSGTEDLFTYIISDSIKDEITKAFSIPLNFLNTDVKYDLTEILTAVFEKMKNTPMYFDFPKKYKMILKVDQKLSEKQDTLVFSVSEISEEVVVGSETFTIEKLEKEAVDPDFYRKNLDFGPF